MTIDTIMMIIFLIDVFMLLGLAASYVKKQIRHKKIYGEPMAMFKMENLTYNDIQLLLIITLFAFNFFLAMMVLL